MLFQYTDTECVSELFKKLSEFDDGIKQELCNSAFTVADVEKAVGKLIIGKAAGFNGIVNIYSHAALRVIVYLALLFSMMSVPDDFGIGVIIPTDKDRLGDTSDVNNYWGITLSPVISKFFEYYNYSLEYHKGLF